MKSPVRRIHKVKTGTNIKETYSDEALELMRDNCTELRDLAMIDMLASTGMRVGEMVLLNREDIDFNERECVVFGKGDKERIVYFDARTKIHLQNYLNSRKDDNPALFVSLQSPYNRMNSRFTNKAREAAREGTPITLIDGNDLIRLVIKYELYITPVTTYVLDGFYTED